MRTLFYVLIFIIVQVHTRANDINYAQKLPFIIQKNMRTTINNHSNLKIARKLEQLHNKIARYLMQTRNFTFVYNQARPTNNDLAILCSLLLYCTVCFCFLWYFLSVIKSRKSIQETKNVDVLRETLV